MIILVLPDVTADDVLLESARAKNIEAQRQIYERYFTPIFQFIRLRLDNREQARDVAADVFLDFFKALNGNNPPRKHLRAWLFRVARNKLYDHYGTRDKFPMTTLQEWIPDSKETDPEDEVFRSLEIQRVRRALNMLVVEQQEVLILRFGQNLSLKETADIMGRTVSAIKSLQFRAVDNLRQILDAGEGE